MVSETAGDEDGEAPMSIDAKHGHDAGSIVAWIAATQGVAIPLAVAEIAARELDAAARSLASAECRGSPNADQPAFLDILEGQAEDAA
jgi:hypothetical protein